MALNRTTTTAIILETRFQKKDDTYPVKLRVTHNRKQKYYSIGYSATKEDFSKIFEKNPKKAYRILRDKFLAEEKKAIAIIEKMESFDFKNFENQILIQGDDTHDIFTYFNRYIDSLTVDGRAGTSSSYVCSRNSIMDFIGKNKFSFNDVTVDFLKRYERWMLTEREIEVKDKKKIVKAKSLTSVGIYLRCLRNLFNQAIREGKSNIESYPFGKGKYQIPSGRNVKKALTLSDIEKLYNYPTVSGSGEAKAKDLWVFSYLCNGINIKDIARLKYKNIDGEHITFIRAKTEYTSRKNQKSIVAILTPEAGRIIDTWGTKFKNPDDYVFPILVKGITPEQEMAKVKQATKSINKYIKRIAKNLKIEKNVTTYTARHSFSTVLKRSGAPIEFISESLGHSDLKTTENYLDSFEDSVKRQYASALTNFTTNSSKEKI